MIALWFGCSNWTLFGWRLVSFSPALEERKVKTRGKEEEMNEQERSFVPRLELVCVLLV